MSGLIESLPGRFTASDRLKDFPAAESAALMAGLMGDAPRVERAFGPTFGRAVQVDRTDGLRVVFDSGEIAHLRPSGNAPELRAYAEADSEGRAREIASQVLELALRWRSGGVPR